MDTKSTNYFTQLNSINVNDKTELKNGLIYLSWAYAWAEVKKLFPDTNYRIFERETEYGPVNYFTDGRTCWVKTGVTINGIEHVEHLPVMNFRNQSIPLEAITSCDVNKAIQRSLTKTIARHGLGLYLYAGEDLPETEDAVIAVKPTKTATAASKTDKTTISSSAEKKPFKTLINEIGKMAKDLFTQKGSMDDYNQIIAEVTGDSSFKCNAATEDQYDLILAIHERLMSRGYNV